MYENPEMSEKVPFLHFPEFFEGVGEKFSPQILAIALRTGQSYTMSYRSKFSVQ
jgi:hypothetical protein